MNLLKRVTKWVVIAGLFAGAGWGLYRLGGGLLTRFRAEAFVMTLRTGTEPEAEEAAEALRELPSVVVVPLLVRVLPERDGIPLRRGSGFDRVFDLLSELTGLSLGDDPVAWREWLESDAARAFLNPPEQ